MTTLPTSARREAERLGRDGVSHTAAYSAAKQRFRQQGIAGMDLRNAFVAAYQAAFDAAGWRVRAADWNSGRTYVDRA